MPEPLAYFLTWTTYGTWLAGDERGWVLKGKGIQMPNPVRQKLSAERMVETAVTLDGTQRNIVETTVREHCEIRQWELHAVNCRSNHVHCIVAANTHPKRMRDEFKSWCTRRLKEHQQRNGIPIHNRWWTEGGSRRYIGDDGSLEAAIRYVLDGQ